MARKTPTISQEELYLQPDEPVREELDDARLLDLDAEEESASPSAVARCPRKPLPVSLGLSSESQSFFSPELRWLPSTTTANAPGAFEWNRAMTSKLMALRMSAARK